MWPVSSLLLPHFRPLVFYSSFFSSFSSTSNLISVTWSTLASSLRFYFFVFFFLCVSWLEYPDIYYFRLLSLSSNFASCSSFLGPYLDPASSTLLAPFAYTLFLLRLRSWSCYPRSFAFFESKEIPLSLFSCPSWYLLSRHIVLAFLTQSFSVQSLLFLPLFLYLSRYLLSHHVLAALNSVSLAMYISFRIILLYLLSILILFHRLYTFLPLKRTIMTSLAFVFCHSLYLLSTCIILTFFKLRFSW